MKIGCGQACGCLTACWEATKRSVVATILALDEIRGNPEALQKTCILVQSIIQGYNHLFHRNYFPKLVEILEVAQSFDFYGFCRLPHYLFHPYTPEWLDDYVLLDKLEAVLCENWHLITSDDRGTCRTFAKERLKDFLEEMQKYDLGFQTEEQFKSLLLKRLVGFLATNPIKDFGPNDINLQRLKVPIRKSSFLEALDHAIFIVIDIACVPVFLDEWGLIDLSWVAEHMGGFACMVRLPCRTLDDWVRGAMCAGFLVQFLGAVHSLYAETLTLEDSRNAKWMMAAAAAELVYNYTILHKKDPRWIVFFAFFAKLFGLIHFLTAPRISFFNPTRP